MAICILSALKIPNKFTSQIELTQVQFWKVLIPLKIMFAGLLDPVPLLDLGFNLDLALVRQGELILLMLHSGRLELTADSNYVSPFRC